MSFVRCRRGCSHWGRHGAAGILVHCRGHVLLQLRGAGQYTACWGVPGGAVEAGESPREAALREAREEVLGFPVHLRVLPESNLEDHGGWAYTTFVAETDELSAVAPADWESLEVTWVPTERVADLPLHPGFAQSWPRLRRLLGESIPVRG